MVKLNFLTINVYIYTIHGEYHVGADRLHESRLYFVFTGSTTHWYIRHGKCIHNSFIHIG